jgi:hypothetical protein
LFRCEASSLVPSHILIRLILAVSSRSD